MMGSFVHIAFVFQNNDEEFVQIAFISQSQTMKSYDAFIAQNQMIQILFILHSLLKN